jgi:small conductance mechanosensitive channel
MIIREFEDTTPLLTTAGILGLAVGFGAQSLVKDVISGFFILFEDQYGVGDSIRIGDMEGVVEHMTLRVTILRNFEGTCT